MKRNVKMKTILLFVGLFPLVVALVLSTFVSVYKISQELEDETEDVLDIYTDALASYFGADWTVATDVQVTEDDYEYIDSAKEKNVEMTIFKAYPDGSVTRYISSIRDESGKRAFGTSADEQITKDVYGNGKTVIKEGVNIYNKSYTVCYKPLEDEYGNRVGMVFAGRTSENVAKAVNSLMNQLIIVAALIIAVFGVLVTFISSYVTKPLQKVTEATGRLSEAKISAEIEISSKIKETAAIVDSSKKLRESLNKIVNDLKNSSVSLKEIVKENQALCTDVASGADVIDTVVTELSNTACSLDGTIQTINDQIIGIGHNIESVVQSVETLSESSKLMNDISENSSKDLADVYEASLQSVESATNISDHMNKLNEAIVRVTAATDMISGIANKTRLLSLNASIEAARAGESGKGFAVVADEIGALAANSAESVKQINEIVEDIVSLSSESSKVIGEIGGIIRSEQEKVMLTQESFKRLKEQVDLSVAQITSISGDTDSLNAAKTTVVSAISDLSAIAEENAASCQECSASVTNIAATINHVKDKTNDIDKAADVLEKYIQIFN